MIHNKRITVVMYHYVRDLESSKFPKINGLDTRLFDEQIAYLRKNYNLIQMEELLNYIDEGIELPNNAAMLTFDDGFIDHYSNVFPILEKYQLKGCFYPPIHSILENKVLDVHKIHHILASKIDKKELINHIKVFMLSELEYEDAYYHELFSKYAVPNRYDDKETIFIKRILQTGLDLLQREILVDRLFKTFVDISEEELSKELYMKKDHILEMFNHGHHFGSHGFKHYWWNQCNEKQLEDEILISKQFLIELGVNKNQLTCCYPYGGISDKVINRVSNAGFSLGFTTEVNVATPSKSNALFIPRLDTNDLPKARNSIQNKWKELA